MSEVTDAFLYVLPNLTDTRSTKHALLCAAELVLCLYLVTDICFGSHRLSGRPRH